MTIDQTAIYNMALGSIGTGTTVAAPDESSVEADALNTWYEIIRDRILGAAFWPSVRGTFRLNLLSTRDQSLDWAAGDPEPGWQYAYSPPSDMLRPRFLTSYAHFIQGLRDINTPALFSNQEDAILVYTVRQTNPALWDANLQFAIAHALGSVVCLVLTGSKGKRDTAWQLAYDLVLDARASVANDSQQQRDWTPSGLVARGWTDLTGGSNPYVFPYAEISASGFGNVS